MTLTLTVPTAPVPKGRPLVSTVSGHPRLRTTKATMVFENWVRACALEAMKGSIGYPLDCPLEVSLRFVLARPPSRPKRETMPDRKPDLDNLEKAVLDGLGLARVYVNDSRIVRLTSEKVYGSPPRVEIEVSPVVETEMPPTPPELAQDEPADAWLGAGIR